MIKCVLFDMDGVLYDSMKVHSRVWVAVAKSFGIDITERDVYATEGMMGKKTANLFFRMKHGRDATEAEWRPMFEAKRAQVEAYGRMPVMEGALDTVRAVVRSGVRASVVTGSAQASIFDNLYEDFPGLLYKEGTVTAYDVTRGKPDPEPYIMGMKKAGGFLPEETIVVENAPLGVQSAKAAGCTVLAVNTGVLEDSELYDAGADVVFPSMSELALHIGEYLNPPVQEAAK